MRGKTTLNNRPSLPLPIWREQVTPNNHLYQEQSKYTEKNRNLLKKHFYYISVKFKNAIFAILFTSGIVDLFGLASCELVQKCYLCNIIHICLR